MDDVARHDDAPGQRGPIRCVRMGALPFEAFRRGAGEDHHPIDVAVSDVERAGLAATQPCRGGDDGFEDGLQAFGPGDGSKDVAQGALLLAQVYELVSQPLDAHATGLSRTSSLGRWDHRVPDGSISSGR